MLTELDVRLLRLLRTRLHPPPLVRTMRVIASGAEHGAIWFAGGLVAAAMDRPRRERWLRAGALAPASIGINYAVKLVFRRPRPELADLPPLAGAPSAISFPSAHTTSSFAAAIAMGRVAPPARKPLLGLAALIAIGRPYLGMHYPSDVLAGVALGLTIGRLVPGLDAEPRAAPPPPRVSPERGAEPAPAEPVAP